MNCYLCDKPASIRGTDPHIHQAVMRTPKAGKVPCCERCAAAYRLKLTWTERFV